MEYREITTQAELDALPKDVIAIVRSGHFYSGSASVRAYDSASVEASGSASVRAYGSASVRAYDSASVWAYGSASVEAYGSASVEASGSASVWAYGSASVRASKFVAIHKHGTSPKITGGVIIEVPDLNECDAKTWADFYGAAKGKSAVVYAAVNDEFVKGLNYTPTKYEPGTTVTAPDFDPGRWCGNGLHFGPTPFQAKRYNSNATRFVAVRVKLEHVIPLGDKIKARSCKVLHEVDIDGNKLDA